ncbi:MULTISPECIES: hypothetical protein [Bradyrhizobium]|uniref:Uncharacterized protein n=1 Tax=Bradyrhizobium neotropicale TaxID=1497615 RepID=A0A176ZEW8_9BRAD|nr:MULTISPECIES: hypothetical protein [Bradyrhizobium]OAF19108.1 hypothetical protein AXW67_39590 [Bradyrhizobium neotropicale]
MADIQVHKRVNKGRTFIRIAVTPKSTETRKLLRQFQAGVKEFEKGWKSTQAYRDAQKAKKKKKARK